MHQVLSDLKHIKWWCWWIIFVAFKVPRAPHSSKQTNLKPGNALNGAANRHIDNQIRPIDKQTSKRNKGKTFTVLQGPRASALYSAVKYSSNQVLSTQQVLLDSSLKRWLKCCTFQHLQSVIVAAALPSAMVALKRVVIFRALLSAS